MVVQVWRPRYNSSESSNIDKASKFSLHQSCGKYGSKYPLKIVGLKVVVQFYYFEFQSLRPNQKVWQWRYHTTPMPSLLLCLTRIFSVVTVTATMSPYHNFGLGLVAVSLSQKQLALSSVNQTYSFPCFQHC